MPRKPFSLGNKHVAGLMGGTEGAARAPTPSPRPLQWYHRRWGWGSSWLLSQSSGFTLPASLDTTGPTDGTQPPRDCSGSPPASLPLPMAPRSPGVSLPGLCSQRCWALRHGPPPHHSCQPSLGHILLRAPRAGPSQYPILLAATKNFLECKSDDTTSLLKTLTPASILGIKSTFVPSPASSLVQTNPAAPP